MDRLEMKYELAGREGVGQIALQLEVPDGFSRFFTSESEAISTSLFRCIHCNVRTGQERFMAGTMFRVCGDADRSGDEGAGAGIATAARELAEQGLCQPLQAGFFRHATNEGREFVASKPGNKYGGCQRRLDDVTDTPQQAVSRHMPERVVEHLEPVKVNE